jgi:hypothetical protein
VAVQTFLEISRKQPKFCVAKNGKEEGKEGGGGVRSRRIIRKPPLGR